MDHKEWLEQKLYVLLYTLLLGISCVYGIFTYYELPLYHLILVAGIIVWILLVIGFDYLYYIKSNKVLLYTLIVAIVVVVLGLLASIQFRIADYRYWLIHVGVRPTAKEMNANTWNLYYLATLLVSLVVVSSFYFICTIFIGRIFAAGAGMIAVLIMVIKESSVIQLIPASLFTYEVVFLIEICIKRCNFDKIKEKKCMSYMAYFPMFFYIILLCFVTTTDKPMEWRGIHAAWDFAVETKDRVWNYIERQFAISKMDEYETFMSGFSEEAILSSGVKSNPKDVLTVKSNQVNRLYLTGIMKNKWNGMSWEDTVPYDDLQFSEQELDFYEYLNTYDEWYLEHKNTKISSVREFGVRYKDINTRTLFYPLKMLNLGGKGTKNGYIELPTKMKFNKTKGMNTQYNIEYIDIDINSDDFEEFMNWSELKQQNTNDVVGEKCESESHESENLESEKLEIVNTKSENLESKKLESEKKEIWNNDIWNTNKGREDNNSENVSAGDDSYDTTNNPSFQMLARSMYADRYDKDDVAKELDRRRTLIYETYLSVPSNEKQQLYELASSVTKDATTKYEKMKLLEHMLNQYDYSLNPELPEGDKDILLNFLFNTKEGYCTYFATALCLLGRSIGIPTRYVQGYVLDSNNRTRDKFIIKSNNAHAWTEAYFDGVGWIPFEPTAPYYEKRYRKKEVETNNSIIDNSSVYENEAYKNQYMMDQSKTAIDKEVTERMKADIEKREKLDGLDHWRKLGLEYAIYFGIVVLVIGFIVSFIILHQYRMKKRYALFDMNKRVYFDCVYLFECLKRLGCERDDFETLTSYFKQIQPELSLLSIDLSSVLEIYQRYRYQNGEMNEEDAKVTKEICLNMNNIIRQRTTRLSYWLFCYQCKLHCMKAVHIVE